MLYYTTTQSSVGFIQFVLSVCIYSYTLALCLLQQIYHINSGSETCNHQITLINAFHLIRLTKWTYLRFVTG